MVIWDDFTGPGHMSKSDAEHIRQLLFELALSDRELDKEGRRGFWLSYNKLIQSRRAALSSKVRQQRNAFAFREKDVRILEKVMGALENMDLPNLYATLGGVGTTKALGQQMAVARLLELLEAYYVLREREKEEKDSFILSA